MWQDEKDKSKSASNNRIFRANREEVIDVEIPDTLDEENREDWIEDEVQHWANNHISITWEEL